jgi:hypothetical protein
MIPFRTGYRIPFMIDMGSRVRQHDTDIDRLWRLQRQQSDGWPIGGLFPTIPTLPVSSKSNSGGSGPNGSNPSTSNPNQSSSSSGSMSGSSFGSSSIASQSMSASSSSGISCPVTSTLTLTDSGLSGSPYVLLWNSTAGDWEYSDSGPTTINARCSGGVLWIQYTNSVGGSSQISGLAINGALFTLVGGAGTLPFYVTW